MAPTFINLLAANHPCIFPPETSSFTAGRPCAEKTRSCVLGNFGDGFESVNVYRPEGILLPFAASGLVGRGNTMMRGSDLRRRPVQKDSRIDLQIEYTEDSREYLLSPGKSDAQKGRGGVVGMMRGAAKGFIQQIRVSRPHNRFL